MTHFQDGGSINHRSGDNSLFRGKDFSVQFDCNFFSLQIRSPLFPAASNSKAGESFSSFFSIAEAVLFRTNGVLTFLFTVVFPL